MRQSTFRIVPLLIGFVVYLALGLTPGGFALCLGNDGHVAVEASNLEGRCDAGPEDSGERPAFAGTHCGPCVDVAVPPIDSHRASFSFDQLTQKLNLSSTVVYPGIPSYFVKRPCNSSRPCSSLLSFPVSLKTTILLI